MLTDLVEKNAHEKCSSKNSFRSQTWKGSSIVCHWPLILYSAFKKVHSKCQEVQGQLTLEVFLRAVSLWLSAPIKDFIVRISKMSSGTCCCCEVTKVAHTSFLIGCCSISPYVLKCCNHTQPLTQCWSFSDKALPDFIYFNVFFPKWPKKVADNRHSC